MKISITPELYDLQIKGARKEDLDFLKFLCGNVAGNPRGDGPGSFSDAIYDSITELLPKIERPYIALNNLGHITPPTYGDYSALKA